MYSQRKCHIIIIAIIQQQKRMKELKSKSKKMVNSFPFSYLSMHLFYIFFPSPTHPRYHLFIHVFFLIFSPSHPCLPQPLPLFQLFSPTTQPGIMQLCTMPLYIPFSLIFITPTNRMNNYFMRFAITLPHRQFLVFEPQRQQHPIA